MFQFIYVLYSYKDNKLYVGCSHDLENRISRHNKGLVSSTKHRRPLELIHQEKFSNKTDAFKRERFLKSLWGGREKRKILENFLKKNKNMG